MRDVHAPRHDGLQSHDDLGADHDGVDAAPGLRAVRLLAAQEHAELVRGSHERPRTIADRPRMVVGGDVKAEDRADLRCLHAALGDHELRAIDSVFRHALLGGLEEELHRAGNAIAHSREHLRHAHQDRGVRIVPAGVHHATFPAGPLVARFAAERHVGFFPHRQRVHVGAQGDDGPRASAAQHADDAGVRDLLAHIEAQRSQVVRDELRRAQLPVAQLGMLVDVAAPRDHFRGHGVRRGFDVVQECGIRRVHGPSLPPAVAREPHGCPTRPAPPLLVANRRRFLSRS